MYMNEILLDWSWILTIYDVGLSHGICVVQALGFK